MFPLTSVRLLDGPFSEAAAANREYLIQLDPDRLLAPFRREAGLQPKKPSYPNWENTGLDGHTGGHYLSALADMIASGFDTTNGELKRRLDYMIAELDECQKANGNGYVGGVPGSRDLWTAVKAGRIDALGRKWVPWYNLHKTFAGLRDAYQVAGNQQAREILIRFGDWCSDVTSGLSEDQMQRMLGTEHGGMNEVLADIYGITGDKKYLDLARRFNHKAVIDPLVRHQDRLTGLHANTQIPKIAGIERIATLSGDTNLESGARFFWETVTHNRSVAFGGNSVSEHFNNPKDFKGMLESREGPETCNTYNMLRLTEQLFAAEPKAAYSDYYERALYNHILASINMETPGFVYFTPIRPSHYRVYSTVDNCFWCCVGTGIENPGKYGEFIYSRAKDGLYVNLFIASELTIPDLGVKLVQNTKFPDQESTSLTLSLKNPTSFKLRIRHPGWVPEHGFKVRVNGQSQVVFSRPSSYAEISRDWRDGDRIDIDLPMQTTVEKLPDGSDWVAILRGPIVLASPTSTNDLKGLRANNSRMGHVASGSLTPLDKAPVLLTSVQDLPAHVEPDAAAGPMHFLLCDIVEPAPAPRGPAPASTFKESASNFASQPGKAGLPLIPFFRLHDSRYQMYWQLTTKEAVEARRQSLAASEQAKAAREANTVDSVAAGEQQPEVEHGFVGEGSESGQANGKRWRRGRSFQYTLATKNEKALVLAVTFNGGETGRSFDILANGTRLATVELKGERRGELVENTYPIPSEVLATAKDGGLTIKFETASGVTGSVFDVRLLRVKP
jgi:DUF1680 family protein